MFAEFTVIFAVAIIRFISIAICKAKPRYELKPEKPRNNYFHTHIWLSPNFEALRSSEDKRMIGFFPDWEGAQLKDGNKLTLS